MELGRTRECWSCHSPRARLHDGRSARHGPWVAVPGAAPQPDTPCEKLPPWLRRIHLHDSCVSRRPSCSSPASRRLRRSAAVARALKTPSPTVARPSWTRASTARPMAARAGHRPARRGVATHEAFVVSAPMFRPAAPSVESATTASLAASMCASPAGRSAASAFRPVMRQAARAAAASPRAAPAFVSPGPTARRAVRAARHAPTALPKGRPATRAFARAAPRRSATPRTATAAASVISA